MLDLSGTWTLRTGDGAHTTPMPVPGDVHSALIAAGVIPHPYAGANELACRWVADMAWTLTRDFEIAEVEESFLDITGLDCVARVLVNDVEVLSARNAFRRYRPDVSHALRPGANTITIAFESQTAAANAAQAAQPFFIPYIKQNSPIPNGNMLRKPACDFGWDWNVALVPFGLTGDIALKPYGDAFIDSIIVSQNHHDGGVDLTVTATFHATRDGELACSMTFGGETVEWTSVSGPGRIEHGRTFHIEAPELWWPAGSGAQPLYELMVTIGSATERRRIGLRQIELDTSPDDAGSRFALRVNGAEIFCRGANWIPADALPANATPEIARKLLEAAAAANMNMIRVWGGGRYEPDWFYDICDELGLLVWQDFMFSCNLYPSTPDFLAEVREEVEYQVARLQHHACIALWCGDNELIGALTWFEESRQNRDRYLVSYDRLNRVIEEAAKSVDPSLVWWPSSPSPGILDFGDAWHNDGKGDMHFWSVWHEGRSFEHYRDVKPRFCSEFGFQSFPSMPVIRKFAQAEDMNIASPVMEHHQRNSGGNARIAETMFRYFRFPMDFENFVYLSQIQQGLAMRTAVEYWRSLKPHCMGTLYWQLNDTWPVASWSGLDHGGAWKALHYMARRFYEPVACFAIPSRDGARVSLRAVNDRLEALSVHVACFAITPDGAEEFLEEAEADVPPDRAVELLSLDASRIPQDAILHTKTTPRGGVPQWNHFAPKPYKAYRFQNPALSLATDGVSLSLLAECPAYYIMVEADVPGHFSDNAFDLRAGEKKVIRFTPERPGAAVAFTARHLHSATH